MYQHTIICQPKVNIFSCPCSSYRLVMYECKFIFHQLILTIFVNNEKGKHGIDKGYMKTTQRVMVISLYMKDQGC